MANEALLIIDYTNDFVADDGALTCGQAAQALDEHITQLADDFLKAGKWVYLPTDVHHQNDPYHPESRLYPPTTSREPGDASCTAGLANGIRNTKMMSMSFCWIRRITHRFAGHRLICG